MKLTQLFRIMIFSIVAMFFNSFSLKVNTGELAFYVSPLETIPGPVRALISLVQPYKEPGMLFVK